MYQIFEKPIYQPIIQNHNIGKYTNEKKMENPITKRFLDEFKSTNRRLDKPKNKNKNEAILN